MPKVDLPPELHRLGLRIALEVLNATEIIHDIDNADFDKENWYYWPQDELTSNLSPYYMTLYKTGNGDVMTWCEFEPQYNWEHAFVVQQYLESKGMKFILRSPETQFGWDARFQVRGHVWVGEAKTGPEAICLAALRTVEPCLECEGLSTNGQKL